MIKVITSQSDPKPKQSQAKMFGLGHKDIKNVENKKMGEERRREKEEK